MKRSGYSAPGQQFVSQSADAIIGSLTINSPFSVELEQANAWLDVVASLKPALADVEDSHVFLEFTIPRMGRRVDTVVLYGGCVFVIEYKAGAESFNAADVDQVVGYALDLKNFHDPSHALPILPILVATNAKSPTIGPSISEQRMASDGVHQAILSNGTNLSEIWKAASKTFGVTRIDPVAWVEGRYKPTPTIVEAAQALYRNHRVDEITRNEAGAENLSATAGYVSKVIEHSRSHHLKAICFITGVPGSGKTLAGLNIANRQTQTGDEEYAVFLSGNGPLVKVLRSALTRDESRTAEHKYPKVAPVVKTIFRRNRLWIGGSDLDILLHQSVFASAALNARRSRNTTVSNTRYADPRSTINGIHHQCRRG